MHELESRQQWFGTDGALAPESPEDAAVDLSGERIGPYRIVRSLGRGGMGEVFLADRADEQFKQQVAIKLVRRGLLSRNVQGRLKLERQILATLDHPNIARLFDGGTTTDGTPYIVMEYVDGEPIDTYCDSRNLTVEDRKSTRLNSSQSQISYAVFCLKKKKTSKTMTTRSYSLSTAT